MSSNRFGQYKSGLYRTPISQFWQIGTLSDVDPDIPNLRLESIVFGAFVATEGDDKIGRASCRERV